MVSRPKKERNIKIKETPPQPATEIKKNAPRDETYIYPPRSQIHPAIDHRLLFLIHSTGHATITRPREPPLLIFPVIDFPLILDQRTGAAAVGLTAVIGDGALELVFFTYPSALEHCENPCSSCVRISRAC